MTAQFIYCSKCGTRNFAEDKFCGVCKTKLLVNSSRNLNVEPTTIPVKNSINWKAILVFIGAIFLFYYLIKSDGSNESKAEQKKYESVVENSPEIQLAIINDHISTPNQLTINLFAKYLNSLQKSFSERTQQEIANGLVSVYNIIQREGIEDSLLELTTSFVAFSKKVDKKFNLSLEDSLAIFVKQVYHI